MTAVASPPSVESGSRLGWYSSANGGQGALSSVNADDGSRMFMPRKQVQRSNSSSSLGSNSSTSSTSTVTTTPQDTHAAQSAASDSGTWSAAKKKPSKNLWPSSKSEPVSGVTNARSQAVPAFSSGPSASSTMSAMHQPQNIVPSQQMQPPSQQNGIRTPNGQPSDNPAVLILSPMNGTFDRKQINVPCYPEVLRIGRQTNAKTMPTPANGFFDSKVLSRQHAEVWADRSGKVWIRDVKSSNGTFVNGHRLSQENRESEPHELREGDTLELGIDIVSEDQSTIVHHKVSSKVEHAGTAYAAAPSILDLNFGDLDPASGGGLLPSPLSQPLPHIRGRAGSNASSRSSQSVASTQLNALHQQRQMNYWNSPISIEQVVKRLTSEMKAAKQQTMDLHRTDEYLTTIMKPGYAEKEKHAKPSPLESNAHRQINGRPKMPRIDSFSRFSDPPAPPPQQPLPEKPDALSRSASESFSSLKRSDTEKAKSGTGSPVSRDSSQILNLIEALSSAKREIETQGRRVKELETVLTEERTARKLAEDKLTELEMRSALGAGGVHTEKGIVPPTENGVLETKEEADGDVTVQVNGVHPLETPVDSDIQTSAPVEDKSAELQARLEILMEEMAEMRKQMTSFKDRAEKAEDENAHSRKSLAEMVEALRQERAHKASVKVLDKKIDTHDGEQSTDSAVFSLASDEILTESKPEALPSHSLDVITSHKAIDAAAAGFATQRRQHSYVGEASPYASMFGVVLLGVGLMAYLNGWQKMDK
ncbi:uncharacterized protein N7515_006610 [Penicillium bovifimosum]|uniref:FHA domain-containing protein n=1 Tax=Penicillium bovifimosum TaxID=126998 RepID=A0A9W9GWD4_9EURO|nr:uncharacterized protein N7515_006610 [Penicillium bovifimosum]KAJ5130571.1 hypothetical protein N7515_006610 [Penicillium bovifimosum]